MKFLALLSAILTGSLGLAPAQTIISPGRAIEIRILGVPNEEMARVNSTYPVSEGGYIRMPYIGNVSAAGKSPTTLAGTIEAAYRSAKIYTNPTVQVIASSNETVDSYVVTIGGQVGRPGPTPYSRGMTLYQAVQAGGGPTPFGSMYRVRLIRDGKQRVYDLNKTEAKGVQVEPNDTIEVPQKNLWGR